MQITLQLPYPPSVNNYWRHVNGITKVSLAGREYKKAVRAICRGITPFDPTERLKITILVCPPDYRRRDLDNLTKAIFDSLSGNAYDDDSQIDAFYMERCEKIENGLLDIVIEPFSRKKKA